MGSGSGRGSGGGGGGSGQKGLLPVPGRSYVLVLVPLSVRAYVLVLVPARSYVRAQIEDSLRRTSTKQ